jgi:hypothetical protein
LKDSPKAVPTTKKGNIPFGEADLAAIVLEFVLMTWQNQCNLNHSTVPELTGALLLDLEAIECVMVEKHKEKLKAKKERLHQPGQKQRVTQSARHLGG